MATGGASLSVILGSDQCFQFECDPCKFHGLVREAKCYCETCGEYLCPACENSHKGSKATRDHSLKSGGDLYSGAGSGVTLPVMFCGEHKQNVLSLLCLKHNSVICEECKATTHRKCNTKDLSLQVRSENSMNLCESAERKAESLLESCREQTSRREQDMNDADEARQQCLIEMYRIRKNVDAFFDKEEERLEAEIKNEHSKIDKDMQNDLKSFESISKQAEAVGDMLKDCKASGSDEAMYIGHMKSREKLAELETCLEEVRAEVKPFTLQFHPNTQLNQMIDDCKAIGYVRGPSTIGKPVDFERWVRSLPLASVQIWGAIVGGGIEEEKLLPILQKSGLSEDQSKELIKHANENGWPPAIKTTGHRLSKKKTLERYIIRKLPDIQAAVVAASENGHMPYDFTISPGFVLTFTNGLKARTQ